MLDKQKLEELITKVGAEAYRDKLLQHARPSIRLTLNTVENEDDIPLGTMKFGGLPDLPPNLIWPIVDDIALHFIAQLRMDTLAPHDPTGLLPKSGMLYFFYQDHKIDDGLVLYFDGDLSSLKRAAAPASLSRNIVFKPCSVTPIQELSIPPVDSYVGYKHFNFGWYNISKHDGPIGKYYDLEDEIEVLNNYDNQILGYPDSILGDVFFDAHKIHLGEKVSERELYDDGSIQDWLLLLQVDSDRAADFIWWDAGRLYYCIKREDLIAKRFENITCSIQST